jgi:hypothetical protein
VLPDEPRYCRESVRCVGPLQQFVPWQLHHLLLVRLYFFAFFLDVLSVFVILALAAFNAARGDSLFDKSHVLQPEFA